MQLHEFDVLGLYVGSTDEGILPHARFSSIYVPEYDALTEIPLFTHTEWKIIPLTEANEMRDAYQTSLSNVVQSKPTQYSKVDFMSLFTPTEMVAIYTAAKTDVEVEIFLDFMKASDYINTMDQRTKDSVAALETKALIADGRTAEILGQ
jgi:hypothetical protein